MKSKPDALRRHREIAGHTQTSLAAAVDLSKQRLSQLEAEPSGLFPTTAKRIAEALGVEITDIADPEPAEVTS